MGTTVIGLIVIAVIVFYLVFIYNRLVSLRNQFKTGLPRLMFNCSVGTTLFRILWKRQKPI